MCYCVDQVQQAKRSGWSVRCTAAWRCGPIQMPSEQPLQIFLRHCVVWVNCAKCRSLGNRIVRSGRLTDGLLHLKKQACIGGFMAGSGALRDTCALRSTVSWSTVALCSDLPFAAAPAATTMKHKHDQDHACIYA